jgi:DNA primase
LYALRELQSNGSVSSSVTEKKQIGGNVPKQNLTSAKFSSIGATTRNIYTDNESRSIVMTIDESEEQTQRIIAFQGALSSGAIQKETLQEYKMQLSNITAMLEDIEIINPFANKLQLPSSVKMHRRLNQHFQDFVCLVTYMHQHQRKVKNNVIETTKEDVLQAIDLFFDVIWIKTDDLSATARKFYEELKTYLLKQDQEIVIDAKISTASFTQRELRLGLLKSKTQVHRMINVLHDLEYVNIKRGNKKRGIEYQVSYWDDYERNRIMLKEHLQNQI